MELSSKSWTKIYFRCETHFSCVCVLCAWSFRSKLSKFLFSQQFLMQRLQHELHSWSMEKYSKLCLSSSYIRHFPPPSLGIHSWFILLISVILFWLRKMQICYFYILLYRKFNELTINFLKKIFNYDVNWRNRLSAKIDFVDFFLMHILCVKL